MQWQLDRYQQPRFRIPRRHRAVMHRHRDERSLGGAPHLRCSNPSDSSTRKNGLKILKTARLWYARAVIAHGNFRIVAGGGKLHFNRRTFRRVADRIAHNVFHRPPQQLAVAAAVRRCGSIQINAAASRLLPRTQSSTTSRRKSSRGRLIQVSGRRIAFGPSHLQQRANQVSQPVDLFLQSPGCGVTILRGSR